MLQMKLSLLFRSIMNMSKYGEIDFEEIVLEMQKQVEPNLMIIRKTEIKIP